ncbi:MAG: rhodanese-like domain-containing protein [Acidobacteriota bacterium]
MRQISVGDLAAMMRSGKAVYLVDVREPFEHELAALPGSLLLPLGEIAAQAEALEPPEDALVVAYCHHGIRSLSGAAILREKLGREAVSLAGGIDAWSREIDPTIPRY